MDAGLGVKDLTMLFCRRNMNLTDFVKTKYGAVHIKNVDKSAKIVDFGGVETWGPDDGNSYSGDDSGIGFDFGDNIDRNNEDIDPNDFVVPDLEDVRRVDKLKIGYAAVARKVDVKRLKRDLWMELEQTFSSRNEEDREKTENEDSDHVSMTSTISDQNSVVSVADNERDDCQQLRSQNEVTMLSFQNTVHDMEANQSQSDVTLPFYFICILHLCNEKGLALESSGLDDFVIRSS
mmetsp:Transcript_46549/g.96801  ORF Transcript_46549/g.96801 Transcript_46549/m.96801 type:complete len:235 (-) Transcript_46549:68-772(-)